jgi:hypothetical protein
MDVRYLFMRCAFAVFVVIQFMARLGTILELLFWLGLAIYTCVAGSMWIWKRMHQPHAIRRR